MSQANKNLKTLCLKWQSLLKTESMNYIIKWANNISLLCEEWELAVEGEWGGKKKSG